MPFSRSTVTSIIDNLPSYLIPVGSYSRGANRINDIDFLSLKPLNEVYNDIQKRFPNVSPVVHGSNYTQLLLNPSKSNMTIDIWKTTDKGLLFAKFARESPQKYVIRSRAQAKRKGYRLTDEGLYKLDSGNRIKVKDEAHLFKLLGLTPRKPSER